MNRLEGDIFFSDSTKDMDLDMIFDFIKASYWGTLRSFEEQKMAMENSMNFGLFKGGRQIAYSRVMTDKVFFAYLLDVFVVEEEQGQGYGQLLMEKIVNYPSLKDIDKWMLATRDAHSLYEKFGFEVVKSPEKLMDRMSDRAKEIYE